MNLRDLEYLVAVADHGHFGQAAAACFVSQPTLSTQLKKLEGELGTRLVERGSRHHLLTPTGEQVVERARRMLTDAESIRRVAAQAQDPRSGSLRLGIFPTLAPYLLPHVMSGVREHFPDLELLLVEERTPRLLEQLAQGRIDAAVLALPLEDESLVIEPLFREDFVLAVPSGHRLAQRGAAVSPGVLADEQILLLEDGHCLRDQALEVCTLAGGSERAGFRATSLETLRHMVATNAGVTLMPVMSVAPPVTPHPALELVRFRDPAPHRDIALVSRRSGVHGELLTELADVLRDVPPELVTPLPEATARRSA